MEDAFSPGTVELLYEDAITVISLGGEHDVSTEPDIRTAMDSAMRRGRPLVVDLTPATFIGSTTLGAIVYGSAKADAHSMRLVVVAPAKSRPREVLILTGLADQLQIAESVEGARELLRAGTSDNPSVL
jgi:anti-anti-sigma factor